MFALNPDPKDDFQFMTCSKGTVKKNNNVYSIIGRRLLIYRSIYVTANLEYATGFFLNI